MRRLLLAPSFLPLLLSLLLIPAAASAKTTLTVTPPYGLLIVEAEKDGVWKEVKRLGFTHLYTEERLDLAGLVADGKPARVRLVRSGGGKHAHLEAIALGGAAPSKLSEGERTLTLKKDNDVLPLPERIVFDFPADRKGSLLELTARVEPEKIPTTPFLYPPANKGEDLTATTTFYDYTVGSVKGAFKLDGDPAQVDQAAPLFNVHSIPGSGHPEAPTFAWVKDDGEKLYVALEFASDNTRDGEADYGKVYAVGPTGKKEYKITEVDTRWGNAGFTVSKRAAYRHKFYEFALPLKDVGAKKGDGLKLAFAAYGTSSVNFPAPGTTIPFGSVNLNTATPLTQSITLSSVDTFTASIATGDATQWTVSAGTCILHNTTTPQLSVFHAGNGGAPNPCTITLTFTPTTAGAKTSVLSLSTTSTPGTIRTVTLTGTGVTPTLNLGIVGRGRVKSGDGQVDCTASCTPTVTGSVTLTATPANDHFFRRWDGACTGSGRTCVASGGDNVLAVFGKVQPTPTANTPPAPPAGAGSDWLVSPVEGALAESGDAFVWKALTDPEGADVTYQLWVCKNGDFDNCTPTTVTVNVAQRVAAALGGAGLLLLGFGFTRPGRRALMIGLAVLLLGGSGALVACGASSSGSSSGSTGGGTTGGETRTDCATADDDEVCYDGLNLAPGSYGWKVIGEDDAGLT
ncbi:MAG: hypothetical protein HQK87_01665, partial [Nitrospinae bacterium]|nr:hypothetical protein [Nitrospinota bacterium]